MFRKNVMLMSFAALTILGMVSDLRCDILFRSRQPWKIGRGQQVGSKITWTDCDGNNKKIYDEPPYSLDQADNCKVGPPAFGLQCDGETCKVVDQDRLRKYIPGARNGDAVKLRIEPHSVDLTHGNTTVHLER